jgi:N-methylhydantoinase A
LYRIGIDVGGTFTDVCVYDGSSGSLHTQKTPSTVPDPALGVRSALNAIAAERSLTFRGLLEATDLIVYGTTVSTNAVLTGRTGRVGLLCTAGFRDTLSIREGGKDDPFNWKVDYPRPYVPRGLTWPVRERVSAEGDVVAPLTEADVASGVTFFRSRNVEVVAVSYLWSIANGQHEKRTRDLVQELWPGVRCVLSHEVNPIIREYRRTVATAIDASLAPIVQPHLDSLEQMLTSNGLREQLLLIVSSGGGVMSVREILERPIYTVGSGPTMAPIAGRHSATSAGLKARDLLVVDMGGTSFDISLVRDGNVAVSRETRVGPDLLGITRADIRSIGAGGGSIAYVDRGGLLHVGPDSAGSEPGPACYGRGGMLPTVADADLLLGYMDPESILGGSIHLDTSRASTAVADVARQLAMGIEEAAFAIYSTVNQNMVGGIEATTVREGVDPAGLTLVAGGGASGLHVAAIAEAVDITTILVPVEAGTLSAFGTLVSDIAHEFGKSVHTRSDAFDYRAVNEALAALRKSAERFLQGTGRPPDSWTMDATCEARYISQIWELDVPLPAETLGEADVRTLVDRFHETHRRIHGVSQPGQPCEFLHWRLRAAAKTVAPTMKRAATGMQRPRRTRRAFLGGHGWLGIPVIDGREARTVGTLAGPLLIDESTTTILVPSKWSLSTSAAGYVMVRSRAAGDGPVHAAPAASRGVS